jgi:hypothetical protein
MMQTAAVVRSFPSDPKQPEDVSRDFAAVGAGSILAGVTGSFAVDASPPSTAAVAESGGTSQVCSLLAIAIIAAIVLLAGGAFAFVPQAALSGVLVYIGLRIVRVGTMRQIYRRGGNESPAGHRQRRAGRDHADPDRGSDEYWAVAAQQPPIVARPDPAFWRACQAQRSGTCRLGRPENTNPVSWCSRPVRLSISPTLYIRGADGCDRGDARTPSPGRH